MSSAERWADIADWEGYYQVSDLGRVRSLTRSVTRPDGATHLIKGKFLKTGTNGRGRRYATLHRIEPTRRKYSTIVARLVAMAFVPNPKGKPEVNHEDGILTNDAAANLTWATKKENTDHACKNGLTGGGGKAVRYILRCPELKITTIGIGSMVRELVSRGIKKPHWTTIRFCLKGVFPGYARLTFRGCRVEELPKLNPEQFLQKLGIT